MKFTAITFALATTTLSVVSGYNIRQIGALNTKEYTAYLGMLIDRIIFSLFYNGLINNNNIYILFSRRK